MSALAVVAQQQVRLRSRDGGFGITNLAQHADAAFLGRTVQCLGQACRGLTPTVRAALGQANALTMSSLLQGMQECVQELWDEEVDMQRVEELLTQPFWRACCGDATFLYVLLFTLPAEGGEGAATVDAVLPHLQARLSDTVHVRRKVRLVADIAAVRDVSTGPVHEPEWQRCVGVYTGAALH